MIMDTVIIVKWDSQNGQNPKTPKPQVVEIG